MTVQEALKPPLVGIEKAAIALVGGSSNAEKWKVRNRVRSKLYRIDCEVFDIASPASKYRALRFDVVACQKRDRTPRSLR